MFGPFKQECNRGWYEHRCLGQHRVFYKELPVDHHQNPISANPEKVFEQFCLDLSQYHRSNTSYDGMWQLLRCLLGHSFDIKDCIKWEEGYMYSSYSSFPHLEILGTQGSLRTMAQHPLTRCVQQCVLYGGDFQTEWTQGETEFKKATEKECNFISV